MRPSPGRGIPPSRAWWLLAALPVVAAIACQRTVNYPNALGPRYAGGAARVTDVGSPQRIRLVTYNVQFGRRLDDVIELLWVAGSTSGPDIVTLQEIDGQQTDRIARAFGMSYVFYPAVVHPKTGRDYGNAILSRWPIVGDRKLVLPHHGRWRDAQRAATGATVLVGGDTVRVYSVHLSTMAELLPPSRREQVRTVLADAAPYRRVLVGGDMNSVGLGEEFLACGFVWPTRDNEPTHHIFTWDHFFLKGLALTDSASTGVLSQGVDVSDHFPVWATVTLAPHPDHGDEGRASGDAGQAGGCAAVSPNRK